MNNTESKEPLYRQLNKERTQGEFICKKSTACIRVHDTNKLITYFSPAHDITDVENSANAQYTALAVNNLSSLAEALEEMIGMVDIKCDWTKLNKQEFESIEAAKEALNKIS